MSILGHLLPRFSDFDFFISYAHADSVEYAAQLKLQLENKKFTCFLDKAEFHSGGSLNESTELALKRTTVLVLLGTENALRSQYVFNELKLAIEQGMTIIPVDFDQIIIRCIALDDKDSNNDHVLTLLGDRLRAEENLNVLPVGPSEVVLNQICESFRGIRAVRRRIHRMVALLLSFLSIVFLASLAAYQARQNAVNAQAQAERAQARVLAVRAVTDRRWSDPKRQTNLKTAVESAALDPQADNHRAMRELIAFLPQPELHIETIQPEAARWCAISLMTTRGTCRQMVMPGTIS